MVSRVLFASADGLGQTPYNRTDTTVRRTFALGGSDVTTSLTLSYLSPLISTYYRDVGDYPSAAYKRHLGAFLTVAIEY